MKKKNRTSIPADLFNYVSTLKFSTTKLLHIMAIVLHFIFAVIFTCAAHNLWYYINQPGAGCK